MFLQEQDVTGRQKFSNISRFKLVKAMTVVCDNIHVEFINALALAFIRVKHSCQNATEI